MSSSSSIALSILKSKNFISLSKDISFIAAWFESRINQCYITIGRKLTYEKSHGSSNVRARMRLNKVLIRLLDRGVCMEGNDRS